MSEESRVSFLRVWLGLLLLLTFSALPTVTGLWLLSLLPLPPWLGFLVTMLIALTFGAWVITSQWLKHHVVALSRWCGLLP